MLIEQVAGCRIVVTGATTLQSSPWVEASRSCAADSEYYVAKFQGLADLYETGCTTINSISRMQAKGSRMLWGAHGMRPIRFERRYSFRRAGRSIRAARLIRKSSSCWMVQLRHTEEAHLVYRTGY